MNKSRQGFTLLELIIAVAAVAVLLVLAFPAFQRMQKSRDLVNCMNRLRQIGIGMALYAGDEGRGEWTYSRAFNIRVGSQGSWSATTLWNSDYGQLNGIGKTVPYIDNRETFICPAARLPIRPVQTIPEIRGHGASVSGDYVARGFDQSYLNTTGVHGNAVGMKLAQVSHRAVASCFFLQAQSNTKRYPLSFHEEAWPVLFGDGSVKIVKGVPPLLPKPAERLNVWGTTGQQFRFWDYFDSHR